MSTALIEEVYYESSPGEQSGPISPIELLALLKSKKVSPETSVWYDALEDWSKLRDTALGKSLMSQQLKETGSKPPPPPPPPKKVSPAITSNNPSNTSCNTTSQADATSKASTSANATPTPNINEMDDLVEQAEMDVSLSQSLVDDNIEVVEKYLQKTNLSSFTQSSEFSTLIPLTEKLKTDIESIQSKEMSISASLETNVHKINLIKDSKANEKLKAAASGIKAGLAVMKSSSKIASFRANAAELIETVQSHQTGVTLRNLLKVFKDCKSNFAKLNAAANLRGFLNSVKTSKDNAKTNEMIKKLKEEVKKLCDAVDQDIHVMNEELSRNKVHIDNGTLRIDASDLQIDIMEAIDTAKEFIKQVDTLYKSYSSLSGDIKAAEEAAIINEEQKPKAPSAAVIDAANALKAELGSLKNELHVLKAQNGSSTADEGSKKSPSKPTPPPKPGRFSSVDAVSPTNSNNSSSSSSNSSFDKSSSSFASGGAGVDTSKPKRLLPPPPPPIPLRPPDDDEDFGAVTFDSIVEVKANNRSSKRLSDKDKQALGSQIKSFSGTSSNSIVQSGGGSSSCRNGGLGMAGNIDYLRSDAEALQTSSASSFLTVGKLDMLGNVRKQGEIRKKAKFSGIFKKRYFILDSNRFEYYEKQSDALNSSKCKVMIVGPGTMIKFGLEENSLLLDGVDDAGKAQSWSLVFESENDLQDWNLGIIAHVHVHYKREQALENDDHFDEGTVATSFWRVPATAPNPVGIRTLPFIEGPKTNNGIYPGEIIEVTQTIARDRNTFLRIGDDRGWVFEKHPKAFYNLLARCKGPSLDSEIIHDSEFTKGSILHSIASFAPESYDQCPFPAKFLKIQSPRGWVLLQNMETGEDDLSKM